MMNESRGDGKVAQIQLTCRQGDGSGFCGRMADADAAAHTSLFAACEARRSLGTGQEPTTA